MQHSLASEQGDAYRRDGYLFPLDVFASGQVDAVRGELEQARRDAVALGLEDKFSQLVRANAQYLLPFVYHVAPPTRNFAPADLELHRRIHQDQSLTLASGAKQELHAAY